MMMVYDDDNGDNYAASDKDGDDDKEEGYDNDVEHTRSLLFLVPIFAKRGQHISIAT